MVYKETLMFQDITSQNSQRSLGNSCRAKINEISTFSPESDGMQKLIKAIPVIRTQGKIKLKTKKKTRYKFNIASFSVEAWESGSMACDAREYCGEVICWHGGAASKTNCTHLLAEFGCFDLMCLCMSRT